MPANPRKQQKRQERRTAKRKAKHQEVTRVKQTPLAERMVRAARYPILESWATTDLWDQGMGWICLSRELPQGLVAFVLLLTDRYCLGVKNVWFDILPRANYDSKVVRKISSDFTVKPVSPATARKFVEASVDYARSLGLHPHADYSKARPIFGDIDPAESTETLEFGLRGMPHFIAGPHDSPERSRAILKALEESCGAGRFHYTIPFADPNKTLPESLRGGSLRLGDLQPAEEDGHESDG